jgi:hypothetical protein
VFFYAYNLNIIAESAPKTDEAQPSDRDQYRRAPEASGDKKGEAGAGSYEFVSFFRF